MPAGAVGASARLGARLVWAARIQQRGEDALADDRRMLNDLFAMATSADSTRELRTYGITDAIIERTTS